MLTSSESRASERLLQIEPEVLRRNLDRATFAFHHQLAEESLLQMRPLVELVRKLSPLRDEVYFDSDVTSFDQRWDATPRPAVSVEEAVHQLEHGSSWIVLRRAELDPRYRALLDRCLSELRESDPASGWWGRVSVQNAIIFLTSPRRLTTYHIDRECNFLLQIAGRKTLYVCDRDDREVLSEQELELFWTKDNNAARYQPAYRARARVFDLGPGDGVHIPVNCPHWVENGDSASIALSINFQFKDVYRANVYRANYYIRKAGLVPTPPGRSPVRDRLKAQTMLVVDAANRRLRRVFEPRNASR